MIEVLIEVPFISSSARSPSRPYAVTHCTHFDVTPARRLTVRQLVPGRGLTQTRRLPRLNFTRISD